jgi:hypothetical protein
MEIDEFKRALAAFADEPSNVDVRLGHVVAQIREDLIDIELSYTFDDERRLRVTENGVHYNARPWLLSRVARLPQLADRILATTDTSKDGPFVTPTGSLTPDLSQDGGQKAADTDIPDAVEALIKKASEPLPGATSVLYLTSDAGEGKTTLINRAARMQAIRYKEKQTASLIVPIPLSGRAFLTFDDAVVAALVNKLRFNYLYFDAFITLVRMGAIVPAFDGYEEMLVEGSKGEAISALGNLVQSLGSSGTVFIAARKAFFEYLSFKTQARLLDAIGNQSASFSRLALSRWNKDQFCQYGEARGIDSPDEIYAAVAARLKPDHPLLTRAVLVRRLFDVAAERGSRAELVAMLGNAPHDYFYTFVDAIVRREASEKWLARVSGDVSEPLLDVGEHHQLLALIAQEMWQTSTTSLRYDVVDALVDLFAEALGKRALVIRQIKERVKQHSLLTTDNSRGQAVAFDHEDFQNFYLGESLGSLLVKRSRTELQAFLSVNLIATVTVEQAIQYMIRHRADYAEVLRTLMAINDSESGFTFCKENCSTLALRTAELIEAGKSKIVLERMFFSTGALAGRALTAVAFARSQFQPTSTEMSTLRDVEFERCDFERIEISDATGLSGCTFTDCNIESLIAPGNDDLLFDPAVIAQELKNAGATLPVDEKIADEPVRSDVRLKVFERFLRAFLRSTQVDEEVARTKLGKSHGPIFFADVLPELLAARVLEPVPWRGRGVQNRYRLGMSMAEINRAMELSRGDFDAFVKAVRH